MTTMHRIGYGRRRQSVVPAAPSPMIDILLATLGVFIVIFALQEIAIPQDRVRVEYSALMLCAPDRKVTLHIRGDRLDLPSPLRDPAPAVRSALPDGGRLFVGLSAACTVRTGNLLSVQETVEDMAARLEQLDREGSTGLLVEIGPLSDQAPYDGPSLLERWNAREVVQ